MPIIPKPLPSIQDDIDALQVFVNETLDRLFKGHLTGTMVRKAEINLRLELLKDRLANQPVESEELKKVLRLHDLVVRADGKPFRTDPTQISIGTLMCLSPIVVVATRKDGTSFGRWTIDPKEIATLRPVGPAEDNLIKAQQQALTEEELNSTVTRLDL